MAQAARTGTFGSQFRLSFVIVLSLCGYFATPLKSMITTTNALSEECRLTNLTARSISKTCVHAYAVHRNKSHVYSFTFLESTWRENLKTDY